MNTNQETLGLSWEAVIEHQSLAILIGMVLFLAVATSVTSMWAEYRDKRNEVDYED